ncbi:hypothetical protein G6F63_014967 [Rhizopus arrhizus]|nr:hypothetical protein G6F63_014967 [Rhizopus arrhizus]
MCLQRLRKRIKVRPGVGVRHAYGLHLVCLQQRVVVEVAGVIHQHAVAGLEQEAADQVDRVRARFATGAMRADRAGRRSRPAAMHRHVPAGAGHDACRPGTASRWASSRSPA